MWKVVDCIREKDRIWLTTVFILIEGRFSVGVDGIPMKRKISDSKDDSYLEPACKWGSF